MFAVPRSKKNVLSLLALLAGTAQAQTLEAQVSEFARQWLVEQAQREGLIEAQAEARVLPALGSTAVQRRATAQCAKPWSLQMKGPGSAGRLNVRAVCPAGAGQAAIDFVLKSELSAEVLVAATALPAGRVLAEADLMRERRDIKGNSGWLSDADAVAGMRLRSSLRAGQPVLRRQLAEALLIKRGEQVRIVARNGAIEVQASGEALDAGAAQTIIRVRNLNTGRTIKARITAAGVVEPADLAKAE